MKNLLKVSIALVIVFVLVFVVSEFQEQSFQKSHLKTDKRASQVKYQGAFVVHDKHDTSTDVQIDTAAGINNSDIITSVASDITNELLKAYSSDKTVHALPLLAHWNTGNSDGTPGMDPEYMFSRMELGEHVVVSWRLDNYFNNSLSLTYYEATIKRAASLNLALVFVMPSPESALINDTFYANREAATNPNVILNNGDISQQISPLGPNASWNEVGQQWSATDILTQIQEWYPNPPLVLFVNEDEANKLSWKNIESSSRYLSRYGNAKTDIFKRTLTDALWIEKYRQLHEGFKTGFTKAAWKTNSKFITKNTIAYNMGIDNNWTNDATVTNQYADIWTITADALNINFDLAGTKDDASANSPEIFANNVPFMLQEGISLNQNFAYTLTVDDNSKIANPNRYRGFSQFALWFLRPSVIREKSFSTDREKINPFFQEISNSVELVHNDTVLQDFWKNGQLVSNGASYLNHNIPDKYKDTPRWFLLDADANPSKPWASSTKIPVWAFALVKGEAPNREWLVYAQSPETDIKDIAVHIPKYRNIILNSSIIGSFYKLQESDPKILQINSTNARLTTNVISKYIAKNSTNVKDFGALGDGITDDTNAFISALAVATELYIPTGNYKITTVNIPNNIHALFGEGTIIYSGNNGGFYFSSNFSEITVDGLTFQNNTTAGSASAASLNFWEANQVISNIVITNNTFIGSNTHPTNAITVSSDSAKGGRVDGILIANNDFINMTRAGMELLDMSSDDTIADIVNVIVDNNRFTGSIVGRDSFQCAISIAGLHKAPIVSNNIINNMAWGIEFSATINGVAHSNIINTYEMAMSISGSDFGVFALPTNIKVYNNTFKAPKIRIQQGVDIEFYDNSFNGWLELRLSNGTLIHDNNITSSDTKNIGIEDCVNSHIYNNSLVNTRTIDTPFAVVLANVNSDNTNIVENNNLYLTKGSTYIYNTTSASAVFMNNVKHRGSVQ